jgi:dipeptidyl aminopeptidase/acylaminoacyl peptidase
VQRDNFLDTGAHVLLHPRKRALPVSSLRSAGLAVLAWVVTAGVGGAQGGPPGTDLHLVPITARDGAVSLGTPVNITARPGYDNQPSFTPDGRSILFTSVRAGGQSDIYRYDLASRTTSQVTNTPESEYSATVMPGGQRFSVIRVERDSTQRLWSFAVDGSDPRLVLTNVKPVGYHAWVNDTTLGLFVLGSPATLQVANSRTGEARTLVGGIGRGIHRIPGTGSLSITRTDSAGMRWLERVDPASGQITRLVQARPRSEDYAWMPDGGLLMAQGNTLHRWTGQDFLTQGSAGSPWTEVASFTQLALQAMTRLAVSPAGDWLVIVAAEPR